MGCIPVGPHQQPHAPTTVCLRSCTAGGFITIEGNYNPGLPLARVSQRARKGSKVVVVRAGAGSRVSLLLHKHHWGCCAATHT